MKWLRIQLRKFIEFHCNFIQSKLFYWFYSHSFGDKFSKEKWLNEVNGQREILSLYGGVKYEDVRGMRAPFLQPGGNRQYEMLFDANFTYDSSLPVFENNPPYWPYTFDYAMSHDCMITPCPSKSFPGKCRHVHELFNCFSCIS